MSDLTVKLSSPSQNKVVLNDSGSRLTLSTFTSPSVGLSELTDVSTNDLPDNSVLVYDSATGAYTLRNVFTSTDDETLIISGGEF